MGFNADLFSSSQSTVRRTIIAEGSCIVIAGQYEQAIHQTYAELSRRNRDPDFQNYGFNNIERLFHSALLFVVKRFLNFKIFHYYNCAEAQKFDR